MEIANSTAYLCADWTNVIEESNYSLLLTELSGYSPADFTSADN
jgi:hypothetical protein